MSDKEINSCEFCVDHHSEFDFCDECKLEIDEFGNTENDFTFCCFPNCGCDGARLCMASEGPNEYSQSNNKEGMWSGKTAKDKRAVFDFYGQELKREKEGGGKE